MKQLTPVVAPDAFLPSDAAWMVRTDLHQTRMLGYTPFNLDAVTTTMLGVLGQRPTVRHVSGVTDDILSFLEDAGLVLQEDIRRYETGVEAEAIADQLVADGWRLFWPYPLRAGRFDDAAHVVAPDLWERLNDKVLLPQIVPEHALAPRQVVDAAELDGCAQPPLYVKAGGGGATGWGYAVHYCPDAEAVQAAGASLSAKGVETVIVEAALDVTTCWCVNLSLTASGVTYIGAAEQLFEAPARQTGSIIDPLNALPQAGVDLALTVGETARALGFRGPCGLDIGKLTDGRLIVFDPNFRFNASTLQCMLHDAASERSGLPVSVSFAAKSTLPVKEMLGRARRAVEDGWFVPNRVIDAMLLAAADSANYMSGFILAENREQAAAKSAKLEAMIA